MITVTATTPCCLCGHEFGIPWSEDPAFPECASCCHVCAHEGQPFRWAEPFTPTPIKPNYVYVASSWRNPMQTAVCASLRSAGIDHYDFKNPPNGAGFGWREVKTPGVPSTAETITAKGADWEQVDEYLSMLSHPRAIEGFDADFAAMEKADTFVLVLPCGKSAHLELGWAVGAGKRTAILLEDPVEPELMYRMVDYLAPSLFDLLGWLGVED